MVRIFDDKRSRIYAHYKEGFSSCYIAKKENVSQSSVVRICNKADTTSSVKDLPKCGASRIFTNRDERSIIRLLVSGVCTNAVEIQKHLRIYENIEVSENTVKRALRRNGLSFCVKHKKPILTKRTRKERFEFAKKYKDWSVEDWHRIIWSDESKFNIYGSDG
ncbi:17709_t:CDS:1, partial [Cetraspora pellucida]